MTVPHRPVADLEEERLRRHAQLEDDARWAFVVEDRAGEAARTCREAIRYWDGCYDVWTLYGAIQRELDQPTIAVQAFRSAARVDDAQAEAYWEIGVVYEARRRPARALIEYRRARERLRRGDALIAISTSGNSANVVRAAERARLQSLGVVTLTGESGGKLAPLSDVAIRVPSDVTAHIQEAHLAVEQLLASLVEDALYPRTDREEV
jgi:tetratricopeptide (TPR) repeat protein